MRNLLTNLVTYSVMGFIPAMMIILFLQIFTLKPDDKREVEDRLRMALYKEYRKATGGDVEKQQNAGLDALADIYDDIHFKELNARRGKGSNIYVRADITIKEDSPPPSGGSVRFFYFKFDEEGKNLNLQYEVGSFAYYFSFSDFFRLGKPAAPLHAIATTSAQP